MAVKLAKRVGRPRYGDVVGHASFFGVNRPQQASQITDQRLQVGVHRLGKRPHQPFPAQELTHAVHPAMPAQLRHQHVDEGNDQAQNGK